MPRITLDISDDLALQLRPVQHRLAEVLEVGLRSMVPGYAGLHHEIIEFLASAPSRAEIMAFQPSLVAQRRQRALLAKYEAGLLTPEERTELDHYENLDFLMRRIKDRARAQGTEGAEFD